MIQLDGYVVMVDAMLLWMGFVLNTHSSCWGCLPLEGVLAVFCGQEVCGLMLLDAKASS